MSLPRAITITNPKLRTAWTLQRKGQNDLKPMLFGLRNGQGSFTVLGRLNHETGVDVHDLLLNMPVTYGAFVNLYNALMVAGVPLEGPLLTAMTEAANVLQQTVVMRAPVPSDPAVISSASPAAPVASPAPTTPDEPSDEPVGYRYKIVRELPELLGFFARGVSLADAQAYTGTVEEVKAKIAAGAPFDDPDAPHPSKWKADPA